MVRFNKADVTFETKVGQGPGGQHRNRTESCVVATHTPTGIQAVVDERNQHQNKRKALKVLEKKVHEHYRSQAAAAKKAKRDEAIKDRTRVRTYDFKSGLAIDHRTGKKAPVRDVLLKGKLDLLKDNKEPPSYEQ